MNAVKRAGVSTGIFVASIVVAFLIGVGLMYAGAPAITGQTTVTVTNTSTMTTTMTTTASSSTSSPAPATGTPILIGMNVELSGVTAPSGKMNLLGAEIAASEVNASGGINGRPLKLLVLDDQSNPTQGLANARIFNQENVSIVVNGANSNVALAVHGYAEQNQLPFAIVSSEASGSTAPGSHWTFRGVPDDIEWGASMAQYLMGLNPTAKVAIISSQFSLTKDLAAGASWYITNQTKGSVVYNQQFPLSQTDYASAVAAIQAAHPDYVMNFILGSGIATFQREMVVAGFPGSQIMIWGENTLNIYPMGSYADGSYAGTFFSPAFGANSTTIAKLISEGNAQIKAHPSVYSGEYGVDYGIFLGYRLIKMIAKAMQSINGPVTRTSLQSAMSNVQYTDMLGKTVSFDSNGAITPGFYIVQIQQASATGWTATPKTYIQFPPGLVPVYQLAG